MMITEKRSEAKTRLDVICWEQCSSRPYSVRLNAVSEVVFHTVSQLKLLSSPSSSCAFIIIIITLTRIHHNFKIMFQRRVHKRWWFYRLFVCCDTARIDVRRYTIKFLSSLFADENDFLNDSYRYFLHASSFVSSPRLTDFLFYFSPCQPYLLAFRSKYRLLKIE